MQGLRQASVLGWIWHCTCCCKVQILIKHVHNCDVIITWTTCTATLKSCPLSHVHFVHFTVPNWSWDVPQGVRSSGDQVPWRRRRHKLQPQRLRGRHEAGDHQRHQPVFLIQPNYSDAECISIVVETDELKEFWLLLLFGGWSGSDEGPVQGGVRARAAAAEHRLLAGQLQVQRRHPAQVRPVGGAHGPVPRQEVRTNFLSILHQFYISYCMACCTECTCEVTYASLDVIVLRPIWSESESHKRESWLDQTRSHDPLGMYFKQ